MKALHAAWLLGAAVALSGGPVAAKDYPDAVDAIYGDEPPWLMMLGPGELTNPSNYSGVSSAGPVAAKDYPDIVDAIYGDEPPWLVMLGPGELTSRGNYSGVSFAAFEEEERIVETLFADDVPEAVLLGPTSGKTETRR